MIVPDPWNEAEHKRRRDETETISYRRAIRAMGCFAKQYDVASDCGAPDKPVKKVRAEYRAYTIFLAVNWANKADSWADPSPPDRGKPCTEREREIIVNKVRKGPSGRRG